jgi:hypothetical protein
LLNASNGFLRYAVHEGRFGTAMPAFGSVLGDQAVEDLVTLVRSWQARSVPVNVPAGKPPPIPLGPVPLNPQGPEPNGFRPFPSTTPADIIKAELDRHARMALLDAPAPSAYRFTIPTRTSPSCRKTLGSCATAPALTPNRAGSPKP